MSHQAGCLCGAVRLTIGADPIGVRQCWCRLCQYLSAGGGTVNVVFPTDVVSTTGEVRWTHQVADSGTQMRRGFCPECGTPIFSLAESRPHLTIVRAGTLDDPEIGKPQAAIWTSEAPSWACFDPELTLFERQPPPAG
jgi:hypothetical protein